MMLIQRFAICIEYLMVLRVRPLRPNAWIHHATNNCIEKLWVQVKLLVSLV